MKNNRNKIALKPLLLNVLSGVGAAMAIGLLAISDSLSADVIMLMAPFGASVVIVFGLPTSPLAQPKNVIMGHMLTAFIGVLFVEYVGVTNLSLAIATGLGVTTMLVTKTTHPPAGANPILIMLAGQTWTFLYSPVLFGAVAIVLMGKLFNKAYAQAQRMELD